MSTAMTIEQLADLRIAEANDKLAQAGGKVVSMVKRMVDTSKEVRRITPPRGIPAVRPRRPDGSQ